MVLYLYGVTRSGHPIRRDLRGVGEPSGQVSLVTAGNLGVAVSPIADTSAVSETDAVRHLDVLVELLGDGPILPLRFGTVAPDEDAVRAEILIPGEAQFEADLDALDGLVELRLVVTANENDELAAVIAERPELRAQAAAAGVRLEERIAVGETIGAQLDRRRQQRSQLIMQRLEPYSRAILDQSGDVPTTSRFAVLAEKAQLDTLDSVVGGLFSDFGPGYECEYIGPLPAADFVGIGSPKSPGDTWGWTGSTSSTGAWGW